MSTNYYFSILLFIILFKIDLSIYIQSFDKDFFNISDKLKQKFKSLNPLKEEHIPSPEIININTDTISADQDHSIKLKLPYKTGDLGTDIMELLYVKKSGKLFSIKNYNVTYFLNEENVIHTIYPNMFPDDIEDTMENDVDCNYTILDNKYKLEYLKFKKFNKIIFNSYITLGLDTSSNNIQRIEYNNQILYESNIIKNIMNGKEYFINNIYNHTIFLNMYNIEQMQMNKKYFAFFVKFRNNTDNKWNILLLFYEIILVKNEEFNLNLEFVLNMSEILNRKLKYDLDLLDIDNINSIINIERIGYFQNFIFLLFSIKNNTNNVGNEFIIFDYLNNNVIPLEEIFYSENPENNLDFNNIKIADFLIYNNTFCLLIEDKGLFIYNIRKIVSENNFIVKFYYNNNLEFESGNKLEIYRNPFYGGIYLGVIFYNKNIEVNEMYMELLLDEFNNNDLIEIKINKIITASYNRTFLYMQLVNDFFSYFYDSNKKELFIFRNGLLNIIPYVTYKLNLAEKEYNYQLLKNENITDIIPIYNKKEEKFNLVLIGNSYIIIKNLTLATHSLNCTFHDIGSYNLTFILKGEICANSLKKAEEGTYVSCHKIIKYNFHVYKRDKEKRIILFISILFIVILLASILFICYSINTGCFGKYKPNKSKKIKKILFASRLESEENFTKYSTKKKKEN